MEPSTVFGIIFVGIALALVAFNFLFMVHRYKRAQPDKVLLVFGQVGPGRNLRIVRSGGTFVFPIFQDSTYLSLAPITIDFDSNDAVRISVESLTVAVSPDDKLIELAATRLLHSNDEKIRSLVREIVLDRAAQGNLISGSADPARQIREEIESGLKTVGLDLISLRQRSPIEV